MGENSMYSEHLRNVDIKYANLIKGCLGYVLEVKKNHKDEEIIGIIMDYCLKYDIDPEEMGDAISQDEYFKQLIKINEDSVKKEDSNLDLDDW